MPKFLIRTSCTAISEYVVEAKDALTASEKFSEGFFESESIVDYQDEEILSVDNLHEKEQDDE